MRSGPDPVCLGETDHKARRFFGPVGDDYLAKTLFFHGVLAGRGDRSTSDPTAGRHKVEGRRSGKWIYLAQRCVPAGQKFCFNPQFVMLDV